MEVCIVSIEKCVRRKTDNPVLQRKQREFDSKMLQGSYITLDKDWKP